MPEFLTAAGHFLRQTGEGLLDLIYPRRCLICGHDGEAAVCEICYGEFAPIPEPVCDVCGRPIDSAVCRFCAAHTLAAGTDWAFASARAAGIYDGRLRHAIHALKYRGAEALGESLGAHLANRCVVDALFSPALWQTINGIVPMPIHPAHRRRRGYNQSELLARPLAEMIGLPLLTNVVARKSGRMGATAQVGLSPKARRANVTEQSFETKGDASVLVGRTLLLVDDVFTTGTSADACARALRRAGAAAVLVVALAAGD